MYYYVIDRGADTARETVPIRIGESLESGNGPVVSYKLFGERINLKRGDARTNYLGYLCEGGCYEQISIAQQLYLVVSFKRYH